jgi:peroxiredoxin/outer membrane lipoprotein-sorting protein
MRCAAWIFSLFTLSCLLSGQDASFDFRKALHTLAAKCESAKEYAFEGELELAGQRGSNPGRILSKAKIKMAVAEPGKYLLRVEPLGKDEYLLVSDGQKSWAYVPKLKQYTEQESATVAGSGEDEEGSGGGSDDERDLAEVWAHLVLQTLAKLEEHAQTATIAGTGEVKYEGAKQRWPVVRELSPRDEKGGLSMTEVTLDPATLSVGRLVWSTASYAKGEKTVIRLTVDFSSFHIGEKIPDSTFTFEPPKKSKLVDAVPIPGQTGSFLLNKVAPDFELKTLDGEKVRLSEQRGHPVLLSFWASWCGPCRRELPGLSKISSEYRSKGLLVLGVNDEGKGTASKYVKEASLTFDTLDDSGQKAHRLYRVHSIPTVFLIDKDGKVVRFFSGARDEEALRSALKSAGL